MIGSPMILPHRDATCRRHRRPSCVSACSSALPSRSRRRRRRFPWRCASMPAVERSVEADLAVLRRRRAQLRHMKDGQKLIAELGASGAAAGLLPHAQPAHVRRRHARAQVGLHQRLPRGRPGQAGLRLDDRRSHLRHVSAARRAAVRPDRVHAEGPVDHARAVPAHLDAQGEVQGDLHAAGPIRRRTTRSGASSRTRGRSTASSGTAATKSRRGTGKSGTRPTSATGAARRRSSASCTTTPSTACVAPCRRRAWAARTRPATAASSRATSSSMPCAA